MEKEFNKKRVIATIILLILFAGVVIFFMYFSSGKKDERTPSFIPENRPSLIVGPSYPSQVLNLENWKLTLPIADPQNGSLPLDIRQPELSNYETKPWFMLTSDKKGVSFRAPVNAPTTSGSSYPRSELREMTDNGRKEAFWPSTSGKHALNISEAITKVPQNKPEVVVGQIHGDDDDLLVIRLEYPKLYLSRSKSNLVTLDENYMLGKRFSIKFLASNGEISVYYNDGIVPVYTLSKKVNEAYFKAGIYTQSNCETEESPDLCNENNYGEVVIYQLNVIHE